MSFCTCGTCGRWFNSFRSREQHLDALGHSIPDFECRTCESFFPTRWAVEHHMDAVNHWNHPYKCRRCNQGFIDEQYRLDHEAQDHFYCAECDRTFQSSNNVRMHLNSRIHRGTNIQCPFCKANYATATGLCHHLENGGCPVAMSLDRDRIYELVRSKDPRGIISKNLIGWNGSTFFEANDNTWNGRGYECYLCNRNFSSLSGLNQHLNSPIRKSCSMPSTRLLTDEAFLSDQQALYHCPNRFRCGREFTSLAGVMNHLESESCGYTRFDVVQSNVRDVVSGNRLIGFR